MKTTYEVNVGSRVVVRETGFANPLCCRHVQGGTGILPAGLEFHATVTMAFNDPECGRRCVASVRKADIEAFKAHGAKDDQIFFPADSVVGTW